jgi:hypothetical protein
MMQGLMHNGELTNFQIIEAAERLKLPLRKVSFKDQLKQFIPETGAYVINMDSSDSGQNGTHWVSLYLTKQNGVPQAWYFDSYGSPAPNEVLEFAKKFKAPILSYSNKQLQALNSNYCGTYVLNFIYAMAKEKGPYEQRYLKYLHKFSPIRYI